MNPDQNDAEQAPTPEKLSAYVDSELPAAEMEATEAWLRRHPEAGADVESLRRLDALWQQKTVPEPAAALWDKTLQGIESRLAAPKPSGGPTWLIAGGIAAACLVGLVAARAFWPAPHTPPFVDEEPYAVATPDDIEIISMDPRNMHNLVVGKPPVHGDLVLATFDDVELLDAKPNSEGQVPNMNQDGAVPLILPTGSWGGRGD
jgi:hypothetical protein